MTLREIVSFGRGYFDCHFCGREHRDTSEGGRDTVGLDGVGVLAQIH